MQEGQIFFHWEQGVADAPHSATQHSLNLETNVKKQMSPMKNHPFLLELRVPRTKIENLKQQMGRDIDHVAF